MIWVIGLKYVWVGTICPIYSVQCIKYLLILNIWFGYCFSLLCIGNYHKTCGCLTQTFYFWSVLQFRKSGTTQQGSVISGPCGIMGPTGARWYTCDLAFSLMCLGSWGYLATLSRWCVIFLWTLHLTLTSSNLVVSGKWHFLQNTWFPGHLCRTVRLPNTQPQKSPNSISVTVYWSSKSLRPAHSQGEGNLTTSQMESVVKNLQPSLIYQSYIL